MKRNRIRFSRVEKHIYLKEIIDENQEKEIRKFLKANYTNTRLAQVTYKKCTVAFLHKSRLDFETKKLKLETLLTPTSKEELNTKEEIKSIMNKFFKEEIEYYYTGVYNE